MVEAQVKSGILEKVQLKLETTYGDGGAGSVISDMLIRKLAWQADGHVTANYSANGTGVANTLTDGVLTFSGSMDTYLADGRELQLAIGTPGGVSPNFTIAYATTLPSFGFFSIEDGDEQKVNGSGFKVSKATIKGSKGNKVEVSYDLVGRNVVETSTTITPGTATTKPFVDLDTVMTINGGTAVNLEDWQLVISRDTETRRGIQDVDDDEKRLITSAFEKKLSVTGSGTAIADKAILRALLGGTTLEDFRTTADIVITISNSTNTITFTTNALISVVGKDTGAEDDLMLMKFDFVGISIAVAGTYTA